MEYAYCCSTIYFCLIDLIRVFQHTHIVEIRVLVLIAWPKSTLLLKIECQDTQIYVKTECLQTKWDAALFGVRKERIDLR